ncbi:MAG: pentapeptide repeat-containing protein [Pikeienuella sp.]
MSDLPFWKRFDHNLGRISRGLTRVLGALAAAVLWLAGPGLGRLLAALLQPIAWVLDLTDAERYRNGRVSERWQQGRPARARLAYLVRRNYLLPVIVLAVVLVPFWLYLIVEVCLNLVDQLSDDIPQPAADRRSYFYGVGLTITGLGALLAAPFILIKAWINERQTDAAEQGLLTDRFTKAVGQLGEEKTVKRSRTVRSRMVTVRRPTGTDETGRPVFAESFLRQIEGEVLDAPEDAELAEEGDWTTETESLEETVANLEVRLGAIYALERIAQDSERDHISIMEVLCAYVRENAEGHKPTKEEPIDRPRADVKAVLDVLGRRFKRHPEREAHEVAEGYRHDLTYTNHAHRDLLGLALPRADLSRSKLEGARLGIAKLEGAYLVNANLEWARLVGAKLEGANLGDAKLEGAVLWNTKLEGARLGNASLLSADLSGWKIARANLRFADLSTARNLTQESVNAAFGDRITKLPDGIEMPEDWKTRAPLISRFAPDPEYGAWLKAQQAKAGKPAGDGA